MVFLSFFRFVSASSRVFFFVLFGGIKVGGNEWQTEIFFVSLCKISYYMKNKTTFLFLLIFK